MHRALVSDISKSIILTVGLALMFASPLTQAEKEPAQSTALAETSAAEAADAMDAIERLALEAFVDGVVVTSMEDNKIPGATIAVVDSDGPLLVKGYGYANAETREAVDADYHLFRIASITKTFTATAIMQLLQQGKLDLNDNVRMHLGELNVDDHIGDITIANLMTHTPGFEDRLLGYYGSPNPRDGDSTIEQLQAIAAIQVRPPGEAVSYSNYGYTLLGEIIAQVSGESYADYVRKHILMPLAMNSSDVRVKTVTGPDESLPWLDELRAREARGHTWSNGWYKPIDWPLARNTVHAEGSMSSTAADMARYMQMHLNRGTLGDAVILQQATWDTMSQPLFRNSERTQANAHGFWTNNFSGYQALQHGGSINEFKSMMALVPELGIGVFVSTNSDSGGALNSLPRRIVERFFPDKPLSLPEPPEDFGERAQRYTGTYLNTRRTEQRFEKVLMPFFVNAEISSTPEGYLVLSRGGSSTRYVEVGKDTFASLIDGTVIQFGGNDPAQANWLYLTSGSAYERPTITENPLILFVPVALGLLAALFSLIFAGFRLLRPATPDTGALDRASFALVTAAAAAWLLMASTLASAMMTYAASPTAIFGFWPSPGLITTSYLLWLATLLSVAGAIAVLAAWKTGSTLDRTLKISLRTTSILFLAMILSFYVWNIFRIAG
ncbi:MAG: serine hydrolase domain-containing protein [Pseudomonadota bacterium]